MTKKIDLDEVRQLSWAIDYILVTRLIIPAVIQIAAADLSLTRKTMKKR